MKYSMNKATKSLNYNALNWEVILLIGIVLLFSIVVGMMNPVFFTVDNITSILYQNSAMGIAAIGMTFVILTGGIDLSAGYSVALGAVTMGVVYSVTGSPWLGIISAILICTGVGAANGFLVTKARLAPFVATLATMSIAQGLMYVVSNGLMIQLDNDVFNYVSQASIGPFALSTVIMVILMFTGWIILSKTKLGTYTYAIGANEQNASLAGIKVNLYKFLVYTIAGIYIGIGSVLYGIRLTLVSGSIAGSSLLMDIIAAVILGGTSITGGKGNIWGTLLGIVLLGVIVNAVTLLRVTSSAIDLFKGVAILLALALSTSATFIQERQKKKSAKEVYHKKVIN